MNDFPNFIKLAFVCGCLAFLAACGAGGAQTLPTPVSNTMPAQKSMPPINENRLNWRLVNGQTKRLADYKGKAVVLDFWATYCPPCEKEIPHLVALSEKHKDDLHVVGLHVGGDDDKPFISDFVTKYQMSYDLGYPSPQMTEFYLQGDSAIPQTLVFDRTGKLVEKFVGFDDRIKTEIDAAIETALNQ